MFDALTDWLFDSSHLTPHGFCLLWKPALIWTYALADSGIALAYFSIPLALWVIARKRRDLMFRPILLLFAAFILLCGATHSVDVVTLWLPIYGFGAVVKAATAIVSIVTAVVLWRSMPEILVLPSPAQFREASAALKATEERLHQSQKMEVVGQLTGGIAHDFNNMIQAVGGGLTLMERRIAAGRFDEVGRFADEMRRALDAAAGLTSRLLAFSRRQTLQPERIEPDRFIADMRDFLQRTVGPEIRLTLELGDGKFDVICDPHQLEAALLNLAINARDAMPNGGELSIEIEDRNFSEADLAGREPAAPGAYVEIKVTDSGVGMSADVLQRAFEPFFTTKPAGKGTGLGLSQLYGFVRQSRGFCAIESKPGAGTSITIELPSYVRGRVSAPPVETEDRVAGSSVRGAVLVVEDQQEVRAQIVEVLADMGCEIIEATDGVQGLQVLEAGRRIDLLVTDVGLPGLNGRQLAEAARALQPDVPVLLVTGYAGDVLDDIRLDQGMDILRKPFQLEEFGRRIQSILVKRHSA